MKGKIGNEKPTQTCVFEAYFFFIFFYRFSIR